MGLDGSSDHMMEEEAGQMWFTDGSTQSMMQIKSGLKSATPTQELSRPMVAWESTHWEKLGKVPGHQFCVEKKGGP